MLVLTRKPGETIKIDGSITLIVRNVITTVGGALEVQSSDTITIKDSIGLPIQAEERFPALVGSYFTIRDNIEVHILSSGNGVIRLGFDAPRKIPILRGELMGQDKAPVGMAGKLTALTAFFGAVILTAVGEALNTPAWMAGVICGALFITFPLRWAAKSDASHE